MNSGENQDINSLSENCSVVSLEKDKQTKPKCIRKKACQEQRSLININKEKSIKKDKENIVEEEISMTNSNGSNSINYNNVTEEKILSKSSEMRDSVESDIPKSAQKI